VSADLRLHPGWLLLGATLVSAAIALNRGIDLLWGVAILLACALLAALLLPRLQLLGLRVTRQLPAQGVVGEALRIEYRIESPRGWPRYGVELHDRLGEEEALVPAAYLAQMRGRHTEALDWTPPVRGCRRFDSLRLECRFPLGLWTARRELALPPQELVVYPEAVALRQLRLAGADDPQHDATLSRQRGGHEEFYALHEYRSGDPRRAIDWRRSARAGELLVRQFEQPLDRSLWIVLDLSAEARLGSGAGSSSEAMFRIAHSVALRARREALPVGLLWFRQGQLQQLPAATDERGYLQLREQLARVELDSAAPPLERLLAAQAERLPRGGAWLLFNSAGTEQRAALAAACRRQGGTPVLVEFDAESFNLGMPALGLHRQQGPLPVWTVGLRAPLEGLFA